MALLVASPWLVVQLGIAVLAPDEEITEMPKCDLTVVTAHTWVVVMIIVFWKPIQRS